MVNPKRLIHPVFVLLTVLYVPRLSSRWSVGPMIVVENLVKRFGSVRAVDGVSFSIDRGEVVGVLGPNGAGKTTMMRILACYLPPSGGRVTIDGLDVCTQSLEVRARIGYMPEQVPLCTDMRVGEFLAYRGRLKGIPGRKIRRRVAAVCERCELTDVRRHIIGTLSKGYRQRVGIADCLLHNPALLILDEPTVGLDPQQVRRLRAFFKELSRHHTIMISSHILAEIEQVCDRVIIVNKGRILASDSPEQLRARLNAKVEVTAEILAPRRELLAALEAAHVGAQLSCEPVGEWSRIKLACHDDEAVRQTIFELVARHDWTLRDLSCRRSSLEDIYVAVTSGAQDSDDAVALLGKIATPAAAEEGAPSV